MIAEDENGENSIEMEGEYLAVSPGACKEECKMDSIAEVSDNIGIKILQSTEAEEQKDSISYYPYVSDSGVLNGIIIINYSYADGPIGMEITIRSNQDEQVDYNNHELEYAGENWNLAESSNVSNIQTYAISQLGIEAILYTVKSDGPVEWENAGVENCESITCVIFMHEGIEYQYIGAVSQEAMKEFLNTLQ